MAYLARDRRREAILKAAAEIMVTDGFRAVTARSVAAGMGASTGIVHHHFASIADLVRAAWQYHTEALIEEFVEAAAGLSAEDAVELFMEDLISPGRESHVQIWSDGWHEAQFDPEFAEVYAKVFGACRDCLADVIAAGRAAGAFRGDRGPVASALTIVTMAMAVSGLSAVRAPLLDRAQARTMLAELVGQELGYTPQWA